VAYSWRSEHPISSDTLVCKTGKDGLLPRYIACASTQEKKAVRILVLQNSVHHNVYERVGFAQSQAENKFL
jgi:hypothetical protein